MTKTHNSGRTLALLVMATAIASIANAQKYPQTEDGATVYYKLLSACPDYTTNTLCLQDDSRTNTTYAYSISELNNDTKIQDWILICANKEQETYHLRNRGTYRYISTEANWVGNFNVPTFATKVVTSNALAISDLGDDQVAISYEDSNGKRYLSATNTDKEQPPMTSQLKNTQWAWKIYRTDDLANGIYEACSPELQIWVENRRIRVSGTDDWILTDLSGMQLPKDQPVQFGHIYIIKAKGTIRKFLVK
ncbi:MAG: hypothetical protein ACI4B5_05470 [Bacteroidaceae bacterium]